MKNIISLLILLCIVAACSTENVSVYQITTSAEPTEAGVITPSNGNYDEGEQVEISASSNEHWVFDSWGGDLDGSSNPESITVDSDKEIVAIFLKREYPVTFDIIGEGTVTEEVVKVKSTDYEYGSHIELMAKPSEGWSFVKWGGDLSESKNPLSVTVDNELSISVYFDENPFDGGDGTVEYPYLISTIEQLQQVEDYLDGNFKLISDIDASDTKNWDGGKGFMPLFGYDQRFNGIFDGGGFSVSELHIDRSEMDQVGIFSVTWSSSVVKNLKIENSFINGSTNVGALAGTIAGKAVEIFVDSHTDIYGSRFVGGVTGFLDWADLEMVVSYANLEGGSYVGGIVGANNGSIYKACSYGKIQGQYRVGGIAGNISGGGRSIEESCFKGEVYGDEQVGGIVGRNRGELIDNYAIAKVVGQKSVGGIIGVQDGTSDLNSGYFSGSVEGTEEVGAMIGFNGSTINSYYWNVDSSGIKEPVGGGSTAGFKGLNNYEMQGSSAKENMPDFDWGDVWKTTDEYPILRWQIE